MSIAVALDELAATLSRYPWGYLTTVSDDLRAHSLAVPMLVVDGALEAPAGRTTCANALARPNVTLVCPPSEPGGYSLIIDGAATVLDQTVRVVPASAVLHRPAL